MTAFELLGGDGGTGLSLAMYSGSTGLFTLLAIQESESRIESWLQHDIAPRRGGDERGNADVGARSAGWWCRRGQTHLTWCSSAAFSAARRSRCVCAVLVLSSGASCSRGRWLASGCSAARRSSPIGCCCSPRIRVRRSRWRRPSTTRSLSCWSRSAQLVFRERISASTVLWLCARVHWARVRREGRARGARRAGGSIWSASGMRSARRRCTRYRRSSPSI